MSSPATHGIAAPCWTRHEVAEHLGISIATVRRMEGRKLHPVPDARGVRRFDADEVRALRAERTTRPASKREHHGELAARVFEQFAGGADLRRIVVTVRVHPSIVRALYAEWLVSLVQGEQRRRDAAEAAEDERERTRAAREHKAFLRSVCTPPEPSR